MNSKRDTTYLLKLIYMSEHYVHPFDFPSYNLWLVPWKSFSEVSSVPLIYFN